MVIYFELSAVRQKIFSESWFIELRRKSERFLAGTAFKLSKTCACGIVQKIFVDCNDSNLQDNKSTYDAVKDFRLIIEAVNDKAYNMFDNPAAYVELPNKLPRSLENIRSEHNCTFCCYCCIILKCRYHLKSVHTTRKNYRKISLRFLIKILQTIKGTILDLITL